MSLMQPGETPAVPGPQPLDEQTLQRLQDDLPGDELLYDLAARPSTTRWTTTTCAA